MVRWWGARRGRRGHAAPGAGAVGETDAAGVSAAGPVSRRVEADLQNAYEYYVEERIEENFENDFI